jgi:hypothetical protein
MSDVSHVCNVVIAFTEVTMSADIYGGSTAIFEGSKSTMVETSVENNTHLLFSNIRLSVVLQIPGLSMPVHVEEWSGLDTLPTHSEPAQFYPANTATLLVIIMITIFTSSPPSSQPPS